jgi:hypothetical protein
VNWVAASLPKRVDTVQSRRATALAGEVLAFLDDDDYRVRCAAASTLLELATPTRGAIMK